MKHLFVLDPIQQINPSKDSSAALMQAAQRALIEVWVCTPSDLQAHGDKYSLLSTSKHILQYFVDILVKVSTLHFKCIY